MARLLADLFSQEQRFCDKNEEGCGQANPRHRTLAMSPQVLTLQLVWDKQVSEEQIADTMSHVEEFLDIGIMYDEAHVEDTTYQLTSIVACTYQHYVAFVFNTKLNTWLMFDDASISTVGTWQDVSSKCRAGRIQPMVLFYCLIDSSPGLKFSNVAM